MNKSLAALLCVNVALAGWLVVGRSKPATVPLPAAGQASVEPTGSPQSRTAARSQQQAAVVTREKVTWDDLASKNLKTYVSNLRVVGCPEETVKDIILAEVNRLFAPREQALKLKREDYDPWEAPPTDGAAHYARLRDVRNLYEEKRRMLRDLLGTDAGADFPNILPNRTLNNLEAAFNALPEAKREPARLLQEDYWNKVDELRKRTVGVMEPADRQELLKLKEERRAALAKILTPEELFDFDFKSSQAAQNSKGRLNGFDATEAETREVFRRTQALEEQLAAARLLQDRNDPASAEARKQLDAQLKQQVAEALGANRAMEWTRAQDPIYRNIDRVAQQNGLPKDSAYKAYDIQKALQQETTRVLSDASLTPEQRQAAVSGMKAEANRTMQMVLGQQAFNAWSTTGNRQQQVINFNNSGQPGALPQVQQRIEFQGATDTILAPPLQRTPGNP